ncbi:MAG: class II D-tagatose-bisphosphate aldolase non-catalytic subunit [Bacteroidota bacterium]
MYLDELVQANSRGELSGIGAVCSAHPWVLSAAIQRAKGPLLLEATCNQVNQLGGYTGMTPGGFIQYLSGIASENGYSSRNFILGGDHLGPSPWQDEAADSAMNKAAVLVRDYVEAGFVKIHLDCSMRLADDPQGKLDPEISARRAAQLAKVAESSAADSRNSPRYVIGSEVPVPGGAQDHEDHVRVTSVEDTQHTIELTREAFHREGLASAWERVIAVVVQPGIEFGDDFVLDYDPQATRALSSFIETEGMIYEAHSTDYQTRGALRDLVYGHFAILKVGPALTFAFREAIFALASIEDELFPEEQRSNLVDVMDRIMLQDPRHWAKYYRGTAQQQALARKFSLSDRIRYYWQQPEVQSAIELLMGNLGSKTPLPLSIVSQYLPQQYEKLRQRSIMNTPEALVMDKIADVLELYLL